MRISRCSAVVGASHEDRGRCLFAHCDSRSFCVRVLQPQLVRSVVERRAALSDLEITADDLAMRAFALWYRGVHSENIIEALKLLERAVALDPDSVRGWGGLSFMNLHGHEGGS